MAEKEKSQHHAHRDDLAGEYKWGDLGQIVLLIVFTLGVFLDKYYGYFPNYASFVPLVVRVVLGGLILVSGGVLANKGLKQVFGDVHEKPHVISGGVFGIVRHPIYVGSLLVYLGILVITMSVVGFLIYLIILYFYYFISKHEEMLMFMMFGDEYKAYTKKVPMLNVVSGVVNKRSKS